MHIICKHANALEHLETTPFRVRTCEKGRMNRFKASRKKHTHAPFPSTRCIDTTSISGKSGELGWRLEPPVRRTELG